MKMSSGTNAILPDKAFGQILLINAKDYVNSVYIKVDLDIKLG